MNAALFPIDYPDKEALIGDSTILAVNDCRYAHCTLGSKVVHAIYKVVHAIHCVLQSTIMRAVNNWHKQAQVC
jgi:hypothetical protein